LIRACLFVIAIYLDSRPYNLTYFEPTLSHLHKPVWSGFYFYFAWSMPNCPIFLSNPALFLRFHVIFWVVTGGPLLADNGIHPCTLDYTVLGSNNNINICWIDGRRADDGGPVAAPMDGSMVVVRSPGVPKTRQAL
jgi:hypothetical protein